MRLKLGHDVWECDCGAIVLIGRVCSCGATYADQLAEKHGKAVERKKRQQKFRKPSAEREFTESYYFKKKGKRK